MTFVSSDETVSATYYQYNDDETELDAGSYVEDVDLSEHDTMDIISSGEDEGFYLQSAGGDSEQLEDTNSFVYAVSVAIFDSSAVLNQGETKTLSAEIAPANAVEGGSWVSSNPDVATVDDGVVTAHQAGTAEVFFVTINGKTANCTITVTGIEEVTVSESVTSGKVYCEEGLTAKVYCASYDANGRMIGVELKALTAGEWNELSFTVPEGAKTAKWFVLDENGAPVCESATSVVS